MMPRIKTFTLLFLTGLSLVSLPSAWAQVEVKEEAEPLVAQLNKTPGHLDGKNPGERAGWVLCHNGWVLETSELKPFAGGGVEAELNRFADAVLTKTKLDSTGIAGASPRLHFTSLTGHTLDLTWLPHKARYAGQSKMDAKAIDYASEPLLKNPWVFQQTNNPNLTITIGGQRLEYDFANWTRKVLTLK